MARESKFGELRTSPIGDVVPIADHDARFGVDDEVEAFVPHDLPDHVDLPASVWMTVSEAMTELGRLDAAARLVPNPQLITRIATRREAVGTSALEGTFADLTELFAAEALSHSEHDPDVSPSVREVMNYTRAADDAYSWVAERPITLKLLCQLQATIVRGTPSDGLEAGAFRTSQVFIGAKNRRVTEARFIPTPPGDQLRAGCERWAVWVTGDATANAIQLIARVAMAHYQFETLHPFNDGNGRVGRLVAVLQILKDGALRAPVLPVSPWLEERAEAYRDHLLNVSLSGDWAPWINFFAQAVRDESRAGHDRIMRLLALKQEIADVVPSALPRGRLALEIADDLIAYPILTVAEAQRRYGRTNQANRDAIHALVEIGVLEPYGTHTYDRLFWNRRVFQTIEG